MTEQPDPFAVLEHAEHVERAERRALASRARALLVEALGRGDVRAASALVLADEIEQVGLALADHEAGISFALSVLTDALPEGA